MAGTWRRAADAVRRHIDRARGHSDVVLVLVAAFVALDAVAVLAWEHVHSSGTTSVGVVPGPSSFSGTDSGGTDAPPVSIEIADIAVHSDLVDLRLRPDGTLAVPKDFSQAGWWEGGTPPGGRGPAVIVGHVDSYKGPGVFYRLRELRPGARIVVRRADNRAVTFVVDGLKEYRKQSFRTDVVYGPTTTPTLRLITCSGTFDRRARSYRNNLVVFASIVEVAPARTE